MKLKEITLENFQGIREKSLEFGPGETRIYGDNSTGKTTIANAMSWLLYDKSSTGEKGFSPKTIGPEGEVHGLNHEVVGTFEGPNGEKKFKKTFYEKYTKVRGRAEKEFAGHTTDYAINGSPVKKKEYDEEVEMTFGDPEQIQILTKPQHFPEGLDWQRRREILLEVCGDVDPEEVLEAMGKEGDLLKPKLGNYTIDQLIKQAKAQRALLNKELEALPSRIDEAQRAIPEIKLAGSEAEDLEKLEEEAQTIRQKIREWEKDAGGALEAEIKALKDREAKDRMAFENDILRANMETNQKINALRDQYREAEAKEKEAVAKADGITAKIKDIEAQRERLLERFAEIQAEVFTEPDTCPTCGQALPAEAMAESRATFNENKSRRLEEINQQGQEFSAAKIAGMESDREEWVAIARDHSQAKAKARHEAEKLKKTLVHGAYEESPGYKDIQEKLKALQDDLDDQKFAAMKETESLRVDLDENRGHQEVIKEALAQVKVAENQRARIEELEAERKDKAAAYEQNEARLHAAELYTRKRAELLDEKINKEFNTVRFRLTEDQVNGGTKDICEVLVPSPDGSLVGFGSANNAARINAGLEIIERLAKHWGKEVPVFIDNAESVTKLQDTSLQTIQLYVSEADKELRIEKGETK